MSTEKMTDEQKAAYVAGAEALVTERRDAAQKAIASGLQREQAEAWRDLREALDHLKGARLDVYGVKCPACNGHGELVGRVPYESHECPLCKGWFRVMPEVAERYFDANGLSAADAREAVR